MKNLGNMYVCHKAIIATQKTTLTPAKPKSKNLKVSIFVFKLIKIYIKKISKYRNPKKYTLNKSINHFIMLLMIRKDVIRRFSLNIS